MGSLRSKSGGKSMGTIGSGTVSNTAPASPKPWDSEIFAPEPVAPHPDSVDRKKKKKPETSRQKSTINRSADRQLGQLEDEGY